MKQGIPHLPASQRLHPYLERVVTRHAETPAHRCAMRALLEFVDEDEPVKVSDPEFWERLRDRAVRFGRCNRAMGKYAGIAKAAVRAKATESVA